MCGSRLTDAKYSPKFCLPYRYGKALYRLICYKEKNLPPKTNLKSSFSKGSFPQAGGRGVCGGNSASPEPKRSPAALLVQSRTPKKSFVFLLKEKIGRAQNQKCEQNFSLVWRALASGGGLASLVWFWSGISDKMSSSQTVKTHNSGLLVLRRINLRFYFRNLGGSNIVRLPVWRMRSF